MLRSNSVPQRIGLTQYLDNQHWRWLAERRNPSEECKDHYSSANLENIVLFVFRRYFLLNVIHPEVCGAQRHRRNYTI